MFHVSGHRTGRSKYVQERLRYRTYPESDQRQVQPFCGSRAVSPSMLSFKEQGHGPALVFLHAYPLDSAMWRAQIEFFSDRYRVLAPDILGFGASQPARPWTMSQMGDELATLLDQLGSEQCILAGLSMGGYISLPFALSHPERVQRLVLAHTRARADLEPEKTARNAMIDELKRVGTAT